MEETAEACEAIDQDDRFICRRNWATCCIRWCFTQIWSGGWPVWHAGSHRRHLQKAGGRHPFLFAPDDGVQRTAEQALQDWETRKRELNGNQTVLQSMQSVCRTLPALWRAEKLRNKAARAGYGTADAASAAQARLDHAQQTVQEALQSQQDASEALGQLLFAAADLAAHLSVGPRRLRCMPPVRSLFCQFAAAAQAKLKLPQKIPHHKRKEDLP